MTSPATPDPHAHPAQQRTDWVMVTILLGLGAYFTFLIASGKIAYYINERFVALVAVGAGLFLLLGFWQAWTLLRADDDKPKHDHAHEHHHHEHDHDHGSLSWITLSVVSLPLLLAVLFPSQPLGAEAVSGGVSLEPIGVASTTSYALAPEDRNVLDWLREFNRASNPAELDGLPVDVIAFVYREPGMTETQFMASRFTVSCCVADAFAIGLPVEYADAAALDEGAWVRIRGTLQAGTFDGERVPIVRPESIDPAEQPETPYVYS